MAQHKLKLKEPKRFCQKRKAESRVAKDTSYKIKIIKRLFFETESILLHETLFNLKARVKHSDLLLLFVLIKRMGNSIRIKK